MASKYSIREILFLLINIFRDEEVDYERNVCGPFHLVTDHSLYFG
jgi:hypothetical protein